jgi:hypothetical protein
LKIERFDVIESWCKLFNERLREWMGSDIFWRKHPAASELIFEFERLNF